jgi:hypothetical protein
MQTLKQEYIQFLTNNFKGLKIKVPLFYNWDNGLRFNLQVGETDTDEYFIEVKKRSTALFNEAFAPSDNLFFVLIDFKRRRRKIRISNYCFRQIKDLKKFEINYFKVKRLYEPNDKYDIRNVAVIKLKADRLKIDNILTAIGHKDFPPRQPRLKFLSSEEIFIINIDKRFIFNMYDDRGLDIIAKDKEALKPLYKKFNDWILDYDREKINKMME